jgi:hypothetical protein
MKSILRAFSFSLCASFVVFCPIRASAQSRGADACAVLAGRITPGSAMQVTPGAAFHIQQVIRSNLYFKCLQLHGQQAAPDPNAAAKAGTFITKAGTFTTFDPPGSASTFPRAINPAGAITGDYVDANYVFHGFLRAPNGTLTTFDPPGSASTVASAINPAGAITGDYIDANYVGHGFLRAPNGTLTTFNFPGSLETGPVAINPAGAGED